MKLHPILAIIAEAEARRDRVAWYQGTVGEPPPELGDRGFIRSGMTPAPEGAVRPPDMTVDEARQHIAAEMRAYMAEPNPAHMLLIKVTPGVGKTTAAVGLAEELAGQGKRVLYAAPRHDFFKDVIRIAKRPRQWYEWKPRQAGDEDAGVEETCRHARPMNTWLSRGYPAIEMCRSVCGWSYIKEQCPYHAQKARREPIVFGQHQHVLLGHPLDFDVVIGDESPINAFLRLWPIPARHIVPPDMDHREPLAELLHDLAGLAETIGNKAPMMGTALITALGGAQRIIDAVGAYGHLPVGARPMSPDIHSADEADDVPMMHLPYLLDLLRRESELALAGATYNPRIVLFDGAMLLALRHSVNIKMPSHVIWLDATANAPLYEAAFQRPVKVVEPAVRLNGRIFQIWDRANGISTFMQPDGTRDAKGRMVKVETPRIDQLIETIRYILQVGGYERLGIITHKAIRARLEEAFPEVLIGHFGGSRGTNEFEGCDGLVVTGTPMPPPQDMVAIAKMLYFQRDHPFVETWSQRDITFAGHPWAHAASGYWNDPDLSAVLWQHREAEIIQAAHRVRLATRNADLWLLTNLPIPELPPTELLTVRQLVGAPDGVDPYVWMRVLDVARGRAGVDLGILTSTDLTNDAGISPTTAAKYLDLLRIADTNWQPVDLAKIYGRTGRPAKALRYIGANDYARELYQSDEVQPRPHQWARHAQG